MKTKIILGLLMVLLIIVLALVGNITYKQGKNKDAQIAALNQKVLDLNGSLNEAKAKIEGLRSQSPSQPTVAPDAPAKVDFSAKLKGLDLAQFQSVHLTDSTVFFGKISSYDGNFVILTDIYYIPNYNDTGKTTGMQQISLVKRGNELSGPRDSMNISLANILFIETLKSDSQIAKAITLNESSH